MDGLRDRFNAMGPMDIGLKVTLGIAGVFAGAAAIATPSKKQQEQAALDLFDRPLAQLLPQERKAAQFQAGCIKWNNFWETKFYPITRQLPGAQNPLLNPYRDLQPLSQPDDDE